MKRLDSLKKYSFLEYENELLQLVDTDYLDEWALLYNNKTQEYRRVGLFQYVIPVKVVISKITGDMFPVSNTNLI